MATRGRNRVYLETNDAPAIVSKLGEELVAGGCQAVDLGDKIGEVIHYQNRLRRIYDLVVGHHFSLGKKRIDHIQRLLGRKTSEVDIVVAKCGGSGRRGARSREAKLQSGSWHVDTHSAEVSETIGDL